MVDFILKEVNTKDILTELDNIGFDENYKNHAIDKFYHKTIKIFNLTIPQANILKQTALSYGADCAVNKATITNEVTQTDVLLTGSFAQLKKISEALQKQPFSLKKLSLDINAMLITPQKKTKLVGILNITPDSFSDGGMYYDSKNAIIHLEELIQDGANMIDIGAESTRPNYIDVDADEQKKRLTPVLEYIKQHNITLPISIDTRSAEVAKYAIDYGVKIINDVSGLSHDKEMINIIAKNGVGIIIQHSIDVTKSKMLCDEIFLYLREKINMAKNAGIDNIIADIGIGFGKTKEQNFELINRIEEFYGLNVPIMVGVSRKSMLGVNDNDNNLKDTLTLAVSYPLICKHIDYLRVHNVKLHKRLLEL